MGLLFAFVAMAPPGKCFWILHQITPAVHAKL
jgi:hypothetical protein